MNRKSIENIKNVIIVVLFLMTILLLYFLWQSSSDSISGRIFQNEKEYEVPQCDEVITARKSILSMGNGSYLVRENNNDEIYELAVSCLKESIESETASLGVIFESEYVSVFKETKSILIKLGYDIPFDEFCEYYGIAVEEMYKSISFISGIGFYDDDYSNVIITENSTNNIYVVSMPRENSYFSIFETYFESADICYEVSGSMGGFSNALIPIEDSEAASEADYSTEYDVFGKDYGERLAKVFFGSGFDFTRRISDGFGNVTYMYGFGEKSFTENEEGIFEYKAQTEDSKDEGFFSALKSALSIAFAENDFQKSNDEGLILTDAKISGSAKQKIYEFTFNQQYCGIEIFGENPAIKITVNGNTVSEYYRNMSANITKKQYEGNEHSSSINAVNVLSSNSNHIYNIINNNLLAESSDKAVSFAADKVIDYAFGYYKSGLDRKLIPCRVFFYENYIFYFDYVSGSPLGFAKR